MTDFTFDDQIEALEKLDFERILKEDGPKECYQPSAIFIKTAGDHFDEFESQYVIGRPFDSDDSEDSSFGYGYGYGDSHLAQLIGGNPASGTFTIALSSLASAICATILLHSCVRSWNEPSHYLLCIVGLFVASVVLVNTLLALLAVCLFKRCRSRKQQGTILLKMHHALSLVSVLLLLVYCSSLERFWGNEEVDASDNFYFHYMAHINRNWMAFLCVLTTFSLTFGVISNLNWPHWNEHHVAVLRWTMFSSSLISLGIGLLLVTLRVCLFAWLHDATPSKIWGLQILAGSSVLLVLFGILGLTAGNSPGRIKAYMVLAPLLSLAMFVPSVNLIMLTYPYATGETLQVATASWLKTLCDNPYCADLTFAAGAAGIGSLFFIFIGLVSANMIRPYIVEGLTRK